MKKTLLIVLCSIATLFASAQCVPDTSITHNVDGIYPDSLTGLPHAYVGVAYNTDIQFKVFSTTIYSGITVNVDSVHIVGVTGLPSGFTYTCTPSNGTFPGGSSGCINLTGPAPTTGMMGAYPLVVNTIGYGTLFGTPASVPQDLSRYTLYIENNVGISLLNSSSFSVGQCSPNPASEQTIIPVNLTKNGIVHFTLVNLLGKEVMSNDFNFNKGINTIPVNLNGIPKGIYLYTVSNGGHSLTHRMIVSEN